MIGLPQALLLDLDGTLIRSEHIHTEGLVRFCAGRGLELSEAERLFVIGHAWQEIYAELRLEARLGASLAEVLAGTSAAKDAMFAAGLRLPVLEGARELVFLAHAAGIPVAIVSGSARTEIVQALAVLEVAEMLRFYLGAEDVIHGKPSPEGYLLGAARLGVDAGRCLVFEDVEAGVQAGEGAGASVVVVAATHGHGPKTQHPRITAYDDLHVSVDADGLLSLRRIVAGG